MPISYQQLKDAKIHQFKPTNLAAMNILVSFAQECDLSPNSCAEILGLHTMVDNCLKGPAWQWDVDNVRHSLTDQQRHDYLYSQLYPHWIAREKSFYTEQTIWLYQQLFSRIIALYKVGRQPEEICTLIDMKKHWIFGQLEIMSQHFHYQMQFPDRFLGPSLAWKTLIELQNKASSKRKPPFFLSFAEHPKYLATFYANLLHGRNINIAAFVFKLRADLTAAESICVAKTMHAIGMLPNIDLYRDIMNAIMADPLAYAQLSKLDMIEIIAAGAIASRFPLLAIPGYARSKFKIDGDGVSKEAIIRPCFAAFSSMATLTKGWKFKGFLHRTLLFVNAQNPQHVRALKFKKDDENIYDLTREQHALEFIISKSKQYHLQSKLPQPVGVFMVNDLSKDLKPSIIKDTEQFFCYVYDTSPGQFKYIVDPNLSEDQFNVALRTSVHDLIMLLCKEGLIFDRLIDLFHGHDIIYNPLIEFEGKTQGKLAAWMAGCAYPNLRENGLADFGDFTSVANLRRKDPDNADKETFKYLARYLLSFELIICARARSQHDVATTQEQIDGIWQQAVRTIVGVYDCVIAELQLMHLGIKAANLVDMDKLQQQLQYWLSTKYIEDFERGVFPRSMYKEAAIVECDGKHTAMSGVACDIPTWNSLVGFTNSLNPTVKDQDIGPCAGPFPVTELTLLRGASMSLIINNLYSKEQAKSSTPQAIRSNCAGGGTRAPRCVSSTIT